MVGASGVLGDDTLEAERVHLREERGAVALDVIEETDCAERRNGVREDALALDEREGPQIESVEGEEVKRIIGRGQLHRGAPHIDGGAQPPALLQTGEARLALPVQYYDFAVDDALGKGQRFDRSRD